MVILLSAGFIATDIMLAKFHEQNTTKFLKTLWPSVILGWLIGIFILEPGKVLLIALYHATKDKVNQIREKNLILTSNTQNLLYFFS